MKNILKVFFTFVVLVTISSTASAQTLNSSLEAKLNELDLVSEVETEFWTVKSLDVDGYAVKVISETEDEIVMDIYDISDVRNIAAVATCTLGTSNNYTKVLYNIAMKPGYTYTDHNGKIDFIELTRDDRFVRVIDSSRVSGQYGDEDVPAGTYAIKMTATMSSVLVYNSVKQVPFSITAHSWVPSK